MFWASTTNHITPLLKVAFALLLCFSGVYSGYGQTPIEYKIAQIQEQIDQKQLAIDLLDGEKNQAVELHNKRDNELAANTYFTLVDMLQANIAISNFSEFEKFNDLTGIYQHIQNISDKNVGYIKFYHDVIYNAYGIITHKSLGSLEQFLTKKMLPSLSNIALFRDQPITESFLKSACHIYPVEVLNAFKTYDKKPYAKSVLEYCTKIAPHTVVKYFPATNSVNRFILESEDDTVKTVVELYKKYGMGSKVYFFLDKIMKDKSLMSFYAYLQPEYDIYLKELIDIRSQPQLLGAFTVDQELKIQSLKYVRKINDMHLLKDASERFSSIDSMNAKELYTLINYSAEEIFTSTFNGAFHRLMARLQTDSTDGYHFLESMHFNQFRTFIKLCAGYNTLNTFLTTFSDEGKSLLFKKFINGLGGNENSLGEAVNVADTFGSLEDTVLLHQFLSILLDERQKQVDELNVHGEVIYGLLISLIGEKITINDTLLNHVELLDLPPLNHIDVSDLSNSNDINIQQHFFFDDEDGIMSYSTFVNNYLNSNWKIVDHEHYIIIQSLKGKPVHIYANKPLSERKGQEEIRLLFEQENIIPSIIVHRGHSYYVHLTINTVAPETKLVFLGSCGSYHNLASVIDRSPKVHIISSKQIGTMHVNNPLLYAISESIRKAHDIEWADIWTAVGAQIKSNEKAMEKFQDYIPPHKNLGAIFLQAYYELTS
jgi:hypothetical protein